MKMPTYCYNKLNESGSDVMESQWIHNVYRNGRQTVVLL